MNRRFRLDAKTSSRIFYHSEPQRSMESYSQDISPGRFTNRPDEAGAGSAAARKKPVGELRQAETGAGYFPAPTGLLLYVAFRPFISSRTPRGFSSSRSAGAYPFSSPPQPMHQIHRLDQNRNHPNTQAYTRNAPPVNWFSPHSEA